MPERLRKIQESIAKKEDGEWALPIYVPQFVSKLVEDLRSRTEGIKVVISLVDPGFLAPIHGNNKYDYTIEDVARWIATHPRMESRTPAISWRTTAPRRFWTG
ncbi:hypothetical protein CC2G_008252 [Coprinopsis cinerea AmutBmut pab1-1]|nr:hypothetical protein CC2G_008252 [Coprinopsis cinerea AmutBmut pab1-1]